MAYFGEDYEVPISRAKGLRLAGQLLKPGFEVVIARKSVRSGGMEFLSELRVNNVCGSYHVACCNVTKDQWLETFLFCPEKLVFAS